MQTNKEGTRSYPQTCRIQIFPKRSFFANFRFYILAFGVYPTFGRIVYPYRFCPMDVVGPDNCFCSHNRFPVHPCKKDHFFSWNVSGITWDGREDRFFWKDHAKFRSENGILLDPLIPIVVNGKQNIKAEILSFWYMRKLQIRGLLQNTKERDLYEKENVNMLIAAAVSICMAAAPVSAATWVKDGKGWWYQEDNGSWPANQWKQVNGQWYWFDSNGYMATGWRQIGGTWYYLSGSGAMVTGWLNLGGTWYYMNNSGSMLTGWQQIGGAWYYLTGSGAMAANTWIGDYYVDGSGAWVVGKTKSQAGWTNPETAGGIVMQMVVTRKMDGSTLMVSGTYLTVPDGC